SGARFSVTSEAAADMANSPTKKQNPTDEALIAIENAIHTAEPSDGGHPETAADLAPGAMRHDASEADLDIGDGVLGGQRAANDDRQSIGQILQSLQHRPPRTSYVVATVFAFVWMGCGLVLALLYLPELQAVLGQGAVGVPAMIGLAGFLLA